MDYERSRHGRTEGEQLKQTSKLKIREGSNSPCGATWEGQGTNFALFSEHATSVELCLFNDAGTTEIARLALPEYTNGIWHGYVEGVSPGTPYGYRVSGPYLPHEGHRFNPNKLLLDPYATAHIGTLTWSPEIFGYIVETGDDTTFDTRDSAAFVPKCIVTDPEFPWHDQRPTRDCRVPWDRTVLYELHPRGYTKLHPDMPPELRGTFAGLGHSTVVEYIQSLGITSIELLPVHTFVDESHLYELQLTNYWGYNSLGFFAVDPRYAAQPKNALQEFKSMVERYHERCMEVILDVVYNHTAEGNEHGPTLSFKGIDNASYYRLHAEDRRYYVNDTGTGNTVNISHPRVLQMVCDSLRYWVEAAHVDGFRFDLGTILAREPEGFDQGAGFLKVVMQDPILNRVKLIAEPWDIGPGGYRVGEFPPGWAEWNDTFRDRTRGFWTGRSNPSELTRALSGSSEIFDHMGRRPWTSINFITAHDGFTMRDLVSYNDKHNLANGEDNRDGSSNNRSWNFGVEGPTDDPVIEAQRERQMRNLMATLILSQGTPMLLAGDEFARTQGGNNNAYCQDNEISWVDWTLREANQAMCHFTARLLALRDEYPMLRHSLYLHERGDAELGVRELTWLAADGSTTEPASWNSTPTTTFGMLLHGCARQTGLPQRGCAETLLILINDYHAAADFKLPPANGGGSWVCMLDTDTFEAPPHQERSIGDIYPLKPQSIALLVLVDTHAVTA